MNNRYTSIELSKKFAEAGFKKETENVFRYNRFQKEYIVVIPTLRTKKDIPAYDILNDLCVKYAKELFGSDKVYQHNDECMGNYLVFPDSDEYEDAKSDLGGDDDGWTPYTIHSVVYRERTETIMYFLQEGKKQEAEDYLWKHCKFNKESNE